MHASSKLSGVDNRTAKRYDLLVGRVALEPRNEIVLLSLCPHNQMKSTAASSGKNGREGPEVRAHGRDMDGKRKISDVTKGVTQKISLTEFPEDRGETRTFRTRRGTTSGKQITMGTAAVPGKTLLP